MGYMTMVVDRNDDDVIGPKSPPAGNKRKKMLFTGGLKFSPEALHICAYCKRIRDEQGSWHQVDRRMILLNDVKLIQDTCDDCRAKN